MEKVAIIGAGNLGQSIADGLLSSTDQTIPEIVTTRRNIDLIAHLRDKGAFVTSDNVAAVRDSDIIILSVKPYNVKSILEEISGVLDPSRHILVSVASSVSINTIRHTLNAPVPVFRAMPNTATHVKESITCLSHAGEEASDTERVTALFARLGRTLIIDESLMEAATILGACGIAFALRFIRAMIQGGIQIGFSAEAATTIASQTVKGAAELLINGNMHPESEIDKVTTPKGCTIVGLNEMEHSGFSSSLIKGIVTSFEMIEQ